MTDDDSLEWLEEAPEPIDEDLEFLDEDSNESGPADPVVEETPLRKKRTAEFIGTVLIGLAVMAFVIQFCIKFSDGPVPSNQYRYSHFESTAAFYTAVCGAVVVPLWIPCLFVSAIRGLRRGVFNVAGVTRRESPVAFWYVFAMYLCLAFSIVFAATRFVQSFLKALL